MGLMLSSAWTAASEQTESGGSALSGSLAVVSQYIYRGGVENDDPALQVGLEYAYQSGLYVGYWGSTLSYDPVDASKDRGIEHDFYVGYAGQLSPDLSYRSHIVTYLYGDGGSVESEDGTERKSSTGVEWVSHVAYQNVDLGLNVALIDVSYANAGDMYFNLGHHYDLPRGFTLNSGIGASIYQRGNEAMFTTDRRFTLNELRLGLSKPVADTGIVLSTDYIYGVHDRAGNHLDDHVVLGLTYNF